MATTPIPTPNQPQTDLSKILGLLFMMGTAAAGIFVKNPNHQNTASEIIAVLDSLLPNLESLI